MPGKALRNLLGETASPRGAPALPPALARKQKGAEEKEHRSSYLGLGGEVCGPSRSHKSSDTFTAVSRPT